MADESTSSQKPNSFVAGLNQDLSTPELIFKHRIGVKTGDNTWKLCSGTPGVYMIRNKTMGKCYIGGTTNIYKRLNQHFNSLKKGLNESEYLQNAWNKYGEADFEFLVMKLFPDIKKKSSEYKIRYAKSVEQVYLDRYFGKNCYNIRPNAFSAKGCSITSKARERLKRNASKYRHRRSEVYQYNIIKSLIRKWESGASAIRGLNLTGPKLYEAARKSSYYNGHYWSYVKDPIFKESKRPWGKPIYSLSRQGEINIFHGTKECAKATGIKIYSIREALRYNCIVDNKFRFSLLPFDTNEDNFSKNSFRRKVVIYKGDKLLKFPSVLSVAQYFNVSDSTISKYLKKDSRILGFNLKYDE